MAKETLDRKDIPNEEKWDIESMYKDQTQWDNDFKKATEMADQFENHKGVFIYSSDKIEVLDSGNSNPH